jgi:outer membrane receptor protein involved in Fe transport
MGPFEVNTSRETGYYAPNTLAGTRIDSRLADLGASITVVTRQQLDDTAAIDINDIFKYEANTEGTFDYNAASITTQGGGNVNDRAQSSPATANRVRGISTPNISINNFASNARIPIDTYNIQSVEIGRGPSSTLFGLGSPSGTININRASASTTRRSVNVELRGDSYGGYRSSINLNHPIIHQKLGVRFAALDMHTAYKQKPSGDSTQRLYGAATYTPFKKTSIRASFENFRQDRRRPNTLTPFDSITEWAEAGKPVWNPVTFTYILNGVQSAPIPVGSGATSELITLPAGLWARTTIYGRPTLYVDEGGIIRLMEVNRLSTGANPNVVSGNVRKMMTGQSADRGNDQNPLASHLHVSNKSIYDWSSINAVALNWSSDEAVMYNVELQQEIVPDLYVRGGWYRVDSDSLNRNGANLSAPKIAMDINTTMLDGSPNPFFMRPYIQQLDAPINRTPQYSDSMQAQIAYEHSFSKKSDWWSKLGRHRFMGYLESRRLTNQIHRDRDGIISTGHIWQTPGVSLVNGPNMSRPVYNYYVGNVGSLGYEPGYNLEKSGTTGRYDLRYYNGATRQWVNEPVTLGTGNYQNNQSRQEIDSRGFVVQSSLLNDRIVVTGGLRRDFNRTRASNPSVIDPATGFADNAPLSTWQDWSEKSGKTRTISVVGRPVRWLGLTYNRSDSFEPAESAVSFFGKQLPNPTGKGRDIGFNINLLNDKLFVTFRLYKNSVNNSRLSTGTPIVSRVTTIENANSALSLRRWATDVAIKRLGEDAPQAQIDEIVSNVMQLPPGSPLRTDGSGSLYDIRGQTDMEATGGELEIIYNPTRNWSFKFAGAETKAVTTSASSDIQHYLDTRLPVWTSLKDDEGNPYWTSNATNSPMNYYVGSIRAVMTLDQALVGKSNEQIKRYTWRTVTNYRFSTGKLRNAGVGGSLRWNSKSAIGYLGAAPEEDGVVRDYDPNRAAYDPAAYSCDLWMSYRLKLLSDRVSARIQLNVQDAFETGGIRPIKVNPDGVVSNYRIVNPRKWVLTTTFEY